MSEATPPAFGQRLARALALTKKSRKELAAHLEVSVQSIGQVINGPTVAMTADNCARAARFLGVSAFWLATGEGEMINWATPTPSMPFRDLSAFESMLITLFRELPDEDDRQAAIVELNQRRDLARARVSATAGATPAPDAGNPYAGRGNRRDLVQGRTPERRVPDRKLDSPLNLHPADDEDKEGNS